MTEALALTAEPATEAAEQEEKVGAIFKPPIGCVPFPAGAGLGAGAVHVSNQRAADYGIEPRAICKLDDDTTVIPK